MAAETEPKNIPGYNPGSPDVARSPISMQEWKELQASAFLSRCCDLLITPGAVC